MENGIVAHCCNILEDGIILKAGTLLTDFMSLSKDDELIVTKTSSPVKPQDIMREVINSVDIDNNENMGKQSSYSETVTDDQYDSMIPSHMLDLIMRLYNG